ncbi:MAG: ABC transporter permease [Oscillospiraceae bacterium]|nr:ABC transporter permease [Oscillospiraceae bacterium]
MESKSRLKHTLELVSHGVGTYASVLIAVIVLGIAFSFASPYFFTVANLKNIGVYMSASGIIAAGVTVSMLLGGLDLSQMSIMAFAGVMVGMAHQAGISGVGLLLVAVLCGVVGGAINAFVMNVLGIDPILTTIGTQLIFRALAYMISKGQYYSISDPLITWIGRGKLFGISTMIWITLAVYIIVGVMLKYTQFGRNVITIGGSPQAAYLSGISVKKTKTFAYIISATCAGLASLLFVAQAYTCAPNAGSGNDMDCIAAVVIGGLSVSGGKGSIIGTALGMLFFSMLANGMSLLSMDVYAQKLVKGALLLLAVYIDIVRSRKN